MPIMKSAKGEKQKNNGSASFGLGKTSKHEARRLAANGLRFLLRTATNPDHRTPRHLKASIITVGRPSSVNAPSRYWLGLHSGSQ